ncbi:MAG: hypothetical protein AAFQ53_00225 [Bacteroidota bacterium]
MLPSDAALLLDVERLALSLESNSMTKGAEAWRELAERIREAACEEYTQRTILGFRPPFLWGALAGVLGTVTASVWWDVAARALGA